MNTYFHSPNSVGVTKKFEHWLPYIPQVPASQTTIHCPGHQQVLQKRFGEK